MQQNEEKNEKMLKTLEQISNKDGKNILDLKKKLRKILDEFTNNLKAMNLDKYGQYISQVCYDLTKLNDSLQNNNKVIIPKATGYFDESLMSKLEEKDANLGLKCAFLFEELQVSYDDLIEEINVDYEFEKNAKFISEKFDKFRDDNKSIIKLAQERISDTILDLDKSEKTLFGKTFGFLRKKVSGFTSSVNKNLGKLVGIYKSTNNKIEKFGKELYKMTFNWERELLIKYRTLKNEQILKKFNVENENILQEAINQFDNVTGLNHLLALCNRTKIEYEFLESRIEKDREVVKTQNKSKIVRRKLLFEGIYNEIEKYSQYTKGYINSMLKNTKKYEPKEQKNIFNGLTDDFLSKFVDLKTSCEKKVKRYENNASIKTRFKKFTEHERKIEIFKEKLTGKLNNWFMILRLAPNDIILKNPTSGLKTLAEKYIEEAKFLVD